MQGIFSIKVISTELIGTMYKTLTLGGGKYTIAGKFAADLQA